MTPNPAQKFPNISHPLSRLGSREGLCVSGRVQDGTPSECASSVDWPFGSPSPQPNDHQRSQSVIGSIPASARENNVISRCSTSHDSRRNSTEEIMAVLEEKLRSGNFHAVKKLFRSNDPNGEGNVTKEAFSRILWHLCGYLSTKKISHVLRRLGLDKKNLISFEDLISYFRHLSSQGDTTDPLLRPPFIQQPLNSAPNRMVAATPRSSSENHHRPIRANPETTASQSWEVFRTMAASGQLDFQSLFPPMCFGEGAYVIPGQLRECLIKLGIESTDDIVARILRKLEGGSPYAIHTSRLFKHLGLSAEGKLLSKTPAGGAKRVSETPMSLESSTKRPSPQSVQSEVQRPKTSQSNEPVVPLRPHTSASMVISTRPITSMELSTKLFDGDVIDYVTKKLDEGQAHFTRALEAKDINSSGLISKPDIRKVFNLLGFNIKATNLEHFLARNGLRRNDGTVNYRLLLRRLQTRSGRGLLNKVMRNQNHVFHESEPPPTPSDGATAALLETKLLDIFQREFLGLLATFKESDLSGTGFLTPDEFRSAIEGRFGIKMTHNSWNQLLGNIRLVRPPNNATQGQIGYVNYNEFLSKFDVMLRPATVDAEDPWVEEEVDVNRLKEHKDRYLKSMDADPADHTHRQEPRPLHQLEATLVDVFLYKFHNFKKEYDLIVREDFCRVDKEKFDYILFRCGFVLTPSELSRLWLSMPITRPMESLSMPTILQQVMRLYYSSAKPGKFNKSSRDSTMVTHVLEKIRDPIVTYWNLLKKKFRYLDPMGTSRIEKVELLQILRGLHLSITDLELHYLVEMLESRIPGKTNYFRLMEYFVKNPKTRRTLAQSGDRQPLLSSDSQRVYPKVYGGKQRPKQHDYLHPHHEPPEYITLRNAPMTPPFKRVNVAPGVTKSHRKKYETQQVKKSSQSNPEMRNFNSYRGNFNTLARHPPSTHDSSSSYATKESLVQDKIKPHIGVRDLPFMGRAFRREDKEDCGKVSVSAFRKVLADYGVALKDPDELYKLLSRYDKKMKSEISYERFMKAMV